MDTPMPTVSEARTAIASDGLLSALAQLIDQADRALEIDRSATRACLVRAAELVHSVRTHTASTGPLDPAFAPSLVRRLTAYIDDHLADPIATNDLTAVAQMSTGHFFRSFKRSFGESPFAFIARRRIGRAQQLMLTTDARLCDIALAVGLCDQSHLTRVFRRLVGESPNAWRRTMSGRGIRGGAPIHRTLDGRDQPAGSASGLPFCTTHVDTMVPPSVPGAATTLCTNPAGLKK